MVTSKLSASDNENTGEGTAIGFEVKDGELCCAAGFRFNHPVKVFELN